MNGKMNSWLLLEHYIEYREAGILQIPDEVLIATKKRQEANDTIGEIKDRIVDSAGSFVKISKLYSIYREWAKIKHRMDLLEKK